MYGKSGMGEIMSGRYKPINSQARHGLTGGHFSSLPIEGIDCSRWSRTKLVNFFRSRYPHLGTDQFNRFADIAMKDGRIDRRPGLSNEFLKIKSPIMSRQEFRKRHRLKNAEAKRKYGDYLKMTVWNTATEKQVRGIVASGASVPKGLMKIAPIGFVQGLRDARKAKRLKQKALR
jgi:hypothetical protein